MKGVVFTEFLEMVEARFGLGVMDQIIADAPSPNGGAYTAVGSYPHAELVAMIGALARHTRLPVPTLLHDFGYHLFGRFAALYPQMVEGTSNALDLLAGIEEVIHVQVRKLHPGAEVPRFDVARHGADELELVYRSERHMGDLAHGLIEASGAHFGEALAVTRTEEPDGATRFRVVRAR